jgi:N-acetylmuramoyl-L-alanine amidase
MPGALAAPLFITHPAEADVATDPKGVGAMASGLADAVTAFFTAGAVVPSATP